MKIGNLTEGDLPELTLGLSEYVAIDAGVQRLPGSHEESFFPNELHHAGPEDYDCTLAIVDNSPVLSCSHPECAQRCEEMTVRMRQFLADYRTEVLNRARCESTCPIADQSAEVIADE